LLWLEERGKAADWWDDQKKQNEKALDKFVDKHPNWFGVVVAGLTQISMDLGAGMVDVIRVGEGVKEGTWTGYAKDALRLVQLAPAVGYVAGKVLPKGIQLSRLGIARLIEWRNPVVDISPSAHICTWVAATKALRQTGVKHSALVEDLANAAGIDLTRLKAATEGTYISEIKPILEKLGAEVKMVPKSSTSRTLADIERIVREDPRNVALFDIKWKPGMKEWKPGMKEWAYHTVVGFQDALGRFRILDRSIGESVGSLEELAQRAPWYGKIGSAQPSREVALMNGVSVIDKAADFLKEVRPGPLSILALEVRSVMLVKEQVATEEIRRIKSEMVKESLSIKATKDASKEGLTVDTKVSNVLYSSDYWKLPPEQRQLVTNTTNQLFAQTTGVNRTLDWYKDRDLCRQWLRIRDNVMRVGITQYDFSEEGKAVATRSGHDSPLINEQALRSLLTNEEAQRSLGLPAPYKKELGLLPLLKGTGLAIGTLHGLERIGAAGEGIAAASAVGPALHPLVEVLKGLIEIGEAQEAGITDSQRHSFRVGFAHTLIDENWTPTLGSIAPTSTEHYYQQKGKEAANLLRKYASPEALASFLKYETSKGGSQAERLLTLMGDTESQQQKPGQQQDQQPQKGQQQQQQGQYTGQGM